MAGMAEASVGRLDRVVLSKEFREAVRPQRVEKRKKIRNVAWKKRS